MKKEKIVKVVYSFSDEEEQAIDKFFDCIFNSGYGGGDFESEYPKEYQIIQQFWEEI